MALPSGKKLRPEEHWRPAQARDLSKYKPRHAMFPAQQHQVSWEEHIIQITKAAHEAKSRKFFANPIKDFAGECGIEGPPAAAHAEGKIVGGVEAAENQWPWIVALFIDDAWFCGGALISDTHVLTAAHCVEGATYFDIMAGAHNVRASSEPHRVEITSYNGFTHENWDSNNLANDVALIELPSKIAFNDYIKPSCLPAKGDTADAGELVTAIGWGKPSDSAGGISPVLRMVADLPIITNQECNAIYGIVGPGVVCINTTGGKGTCNGDSGGPLNTKSGMKAAGQQWTQVGVVSFGASAGCEVGYPAGFSRTEYYLDWISQNTGLKTY